MVHLFCHHSLSAFCLKSFNSLLGVKLFSCNKTKQFHLREKRNITNLPEAFQLGTMEYALSVWVKILLFLQWVSTHCLSVLVVERLSLKSIF